MNPDDTPIPEDDAIARGARGALDRIAHDQRIDPSWPDVQKAARRTQQKRLSVLGAVSALVLVSATAAAVASADHHGRPVRVVGNEPTLTTVAGTSTSEPSSFDSSSAAPTTGAGPISDGVPPATNPGAVDTTVPPPLQPQDGSWRASMSVDATATEVGGYVTVRAKLENTGTQPQQTNGYGSLAIVCSRWLPTHEAAPGWPVAEFVDPVVVAPGTAQSFSLTFWANEQQIGDATCTVGLAFHGDAPWAGPFAGLETDRVAIEIVARVGTSAV